MATYTKKVNVYPNIPVFVNGARIAKPLLNVELTYSTILTCLRARAKVEEICKNGKIIKLSFSNYNKINDTSVAVEEKVVPPTEEPIVPPAEIAVEPLVEDTVETNDDELVETISTTEEEVVETESIEDEEIESETTETIPTSNIRKNKKRR